MEFLDLPFDEVTQIKKNGQVRFDFPAVTFYKSTGVLHASFNKWCGTKFNKAKYLKIYSNAEYLIFSPTDKVDNHCFKITYQGSSNAIVVSTVIERFAVDGKTFKVYQTQKGFAIKLNEPILNRKE